MKHQVSYEIEMDNAGIVGISLSFDATQLDDRDAKFVADLMQMFADRARPARITLPVLNGGGFDMPCAAVSS